MRVTQAAKGFWTGGVKRSWFKQRKIKVRSEWTRLEGKNRYSVAFDDGKREGSMNGFQEKTGE